MMHPDLHEYLEGGRPKETLDPAQAGRAEAWDRLLAAAREEERTPPWLEGRVMSALAARAAEPAWRRGLRALVEPRTVSFRLRPALAAAVLVLAAALVWRAAAGPEGPAPVSRAAPAAGEAVLVQFIFEAPHARSVAVAGSFNAWAPEATLLSDPDGDGIWTALVPLRPGVHQYMFVVDGAEWVADPRATRFVADGFGRDNALLTVGDRAT